MTKRISTAAYLAGVTTLAVSLPMMAAARTADPLQQGPRSQQAGISTNVLIEEDKSES